MSSADLGRQLHDPGLRDLADARHRRAAPGLRLGLAALRVPLPDVDVGPQPGELLADLRIVGPAHPARERDELAERDDACCRRAARPCAASPASRPSAPPFGPGLGKPAWPPPAPMPGPLEEERRLRDRPAVALAADQVGVVADRAVEEDLVEHRLARHLAQRADRHAGLVEREREPRDAGMLRHVGVGAREQHAVVRLAAPCCSTPSAR